MEKTIRYKIYKFISPILYGVFNFALCPLPHFLIFRSDILTRYWSQKYCMAEDMVAAFCCLFGFGEIHNWENNRINQLFFGTESDPEIRKLVEEALKIIKEMNEK